MFDTSYSGSEAIDGAEIMGQCFMSKCTCDGQRYSGVFSLCTQGTRHAEFQAIDEVLEQCGGDVVAANFPG